MSNTLNLSEDKNWLSLKKDIKTVVGDRVLFSYDTKLKCFIQLL